MFTVMPGSRRPDPRLRRPAQGALSARRHGQARRRSGDLLHPHSTRRVVLVLVYAKAKFDSIGPMC